MASGGDATLPATRRTRRSIGGKDRENATIDVGAATAGSTATRKKSRSKSIGPGSLDILKPGAGNRRASLAAPPKPLPRGILKQPIQPLPELPPFRFRDAALSTPTGSPGTATGTKIALKTEEEQQAAAREREEQERLQIAKEESDRREARRKSLANRRVSFANEATLHQWDAIEPLDPDATTSTDRTRRASSAPQMPSSDASEPPSTPPQAVIEEPVDHDDQREAHQKKNRRSSHGIPSNHNSDFTHSSTIYSSDSEHGDGVAEIQGEEMSDSDSEVEDGTMMTVEADEMTSASVTGAQSVYEEEGEDSTSLEENLRAASQRASTRRVDDSDDEEAIGGFGWIKKSNAAPQPVSEVTAKMMEDVQRSPEKEDEEEMSSEMEMDVDDDMEMEMTSAVGGILRSAKQPTPSPQKDAEEEEDMDMEMDEDMSMDVTKVLGGIIAMGKPSTTRRQSVRHLPLPAPEEDDDDDGGATMEFTMVVGGIKSSVGRLSDGSTDLEGMEDMSMEITTAIGTVLPSSKAKGRSPAQNRRRSMAPRKRPADDDEDDGAMDMTTAVGRILPTVHKEDEDGDEDVGMDMTMGMEMTTAIGGILKPAPQAQVGHVAKKAKEDKADELARPQPSVNVRSPSPKRVIGTIANENGSPAMTGTRDRGAQRTSLRAGTTMPKSASPKKSKADATSAPKTATPSKTQTKTASSLIRASSRTPSPAKVAVPSVRASSRTPSPAKVAAPSARAAARTPSPAKMMDPPSSSPMRNASPSPVRNKSPVNAKTTTPRSAMKSRLSLFLQNPETGATTPRVVLSPHRRTMTGVGADRPGLGSPRISEILDRRESIGDASAAFSPIPMAALPRKGVSFADPRAMAVEVDQERKEEEDRENARKVLEREADGDMTGNLRDMISALSPVKPPRPQFKGRKSLAVGSGKGLLGKRPVELDEDDEDERQDGVKRLKGLQGSPVKNVRLASPPSKEETLTGRQMRSAIREDTATPSVGMSPKRNRSPENKGRFRSVDDQPTATLDLAHTAVISEAEVARVGDEDRIHLQDFLNMTSIRFMELTTTKRRHTIAPTQARGSGVVDPKDEMSLDRCVVAGAVTVPMLQLYQHSCKELKKYISDGRKVVREIEAETFQTQPALFHEYMSASPDVKLIMDNQFKNVKTSARLFSKAQWYDWRMTLLEAHKGDLLEVAVGMTQDDETLAQQEELLHSVLPELVKKCERLERENEDLEAVARELADCDPAELEAARADLMIMDRQIEEKMQQVALLRQQQEESVESIKTMSARKEQCLEDIKEADKIREECRGWSSSEIATLKAKVDQLEKSHGWAITGIANTTISLSYLREIELVLDMAAFPPAVNTTTIGNANIDLWYIASARKHNPIPTTPEREFYLQCIRDQIRSLPQRSTKLSRLLAIVSAAWDQAREVGRHVRSLNLAFPTKVVKTGDAKVEVRTEVLVVSARSKVEVVIEMTGEVGQGGSGDVVVDVNPRARVVYGETFNERKMTEMLVGRIGLGENKKEAWGSVVEELHGRLLARGRKA